MQLRERVEGRMAELRVETGRRFLKKEAEYICKQYMQHDVEDEKHFLLQLEDVIKESEVLERYWIELVEGITGIK